MALTGTVKGRYVDTAGDPIKGKIVFTPTPKWLLNLTAEPPETILPNAVAATLEDGQFELQLIATDDPDLNPGGWTYRVQFVLAGGKTIESFPLAVPAGSTVDMAEATPVALSNGVPIVRGPGLPDWSEAEDGQVVVLADGVPVWGVVSGGGGGSVTWSTLPGKPSTFPPGPHAHGTGDVTGLAEYIRDTIGAALREGEHVEIDVDNVAETITIGVPGLTDALDGKVENLGGAAGLWAGTQTEYDQLSSTAGVHLIVED